MKNKVIQPWLILGACIGESGFPSMNKLLDSQGILLLRVWPWQIRLRKKTNSAIVLLRLKYGENHWRLGWFGLYITADQVGVIEKLRLGMTLERLEKRQGPFSALWADLSKRLQRSKNFVKGFRLWE